jgi:excisionase family DNA binding protein
MAVTVMRAGPVQASEREVQAARQIDAMFHGPRGGRAAKLIAPTGEQVELPGALSQALRQVVHLLAEGHAVSIVPHGKMLTTQQAADLLNMSRPYLIRLLEAGKISFTKVGTHRRIRLDDLLRYRAQRDSERRRKLSEMTQMSQKLGLYGKR